MSYIPCNINHDTYGCTYISDAEGGFFTTCQNCLNYCYTKNDKGELVPKRECDIIPTIPCNAYEGLCTPSPTLAQQQRYSTSSNGKQNGKQKQENYWLWILIVAGLLLFIFLMYVLSKKLQKK